MAETYAYDPEGRWRVRVKAFKNGWAVYQEAGGNIRTQARIGKKWKNHAVTELTLKVVFFANRLDLAGAWGPLEPLQPRGGTERHVDWLQSKLSSPGAWHLEEINGVKYKIRGVTASGVMKVGGDVIHVGPVSAGKVFR